MNEQPYVDYAAAAGAMWGDNQLMIIAGVFIDKQLYPEEWI